MSEMNPEDWNRLILDAYRIGREDYQKRLAGMMQVVSADAVRQQDQKASEPKHEATREFREHMAADVVKWFWSNLPQNEIKWSSLSYRAKNEITDTIDSAVHAALIAYFGDAK